MQENLAFLQVAKKPNGKNRKITEAILKVQDGLNKNNLGVQEKDIDCSLNQIWDFFFTLILNNSLSIQNSIERCASIFILRNYSFYPEKIEKLLINQIKQRKKISAKKKVVTKETAKTSDQDATNDEKEGEMNESQSNSQYESIVYEPSYAKYDNLLLQLFTIISPKISPMRIDTFLDSCKENGLLSIFTMKGNQTINNTVPKFISNLKCLGIDFHIDLLSAFLSEKVEYAQIKSINSIIDNYPSLFRRVLSTNNYSLISFILSIHNNSNDEIHSNIASRYFSNINNFPRTDDLINLLHQSTTVTDIDNFLMILSCDKDVKIKILNKNESNEEESQEEEEEEKSDEENDIENKVVKFYSTSKFSQTLPLSQVIGRSSFYNFADLPIKYLIPRDNDSVFILTIKFQKIAQRATLKNCKKIFSIFDHFLNQRKSQTQSEKSEKSDEFVSSSSFYDELTSACLQNLPICINIFSVLPEFSVFLKKVLLVKPASWLHASDISRVLGSLNLVHFNQIGGLTSVISKLVQFAMSSNKQLSNTAIESIAKISNTNNGDLILQVIYNSFDDFDSQNVSVILQIVSKIVEKNNFYFCILTSFLERVLEITLIFQDDLFLISEILHFAATIKNKTKLQSYSSNSYVLDDNFKHGTFGYGKKLKYLKEIALSLILAYIQFFTGSTNFHPPQTNHTLVDNLYSLLQNYIDSNDFDQINFTFLFNAFDFLTAFPSTNYKTLSLILCDDFLNVFPKEVSEFTVKYAQSAITQSFYKAFNYFSNAKDIEVGAIWCNVYIKIADNTPENPVNKQLDDKVNPVFEKMADFAFASPTRVSKYCLNTLSLFLLKFCPVKTKLVTLIENLSNKEAKQSTLYFLYKENETEFNFIFPNIKPIKGNKFQVEDDENTNKRKSNLSDDYSDDEEEESDFDHIGEIDSDSFSDKSQQDEFAFTLKKVSYKDLLQNYLNEKDDDNSKNYLIQTQIKYSLIEFSIDQLKQLINNYFELCDYESLFNLIIYCMRFHRDFPFSEFTEKFAITPFKNLSIFISNAKKLNNTNQKENKKIGIPTSVISLTSAYLMNEHANETDDVKDYDIFDQFLYYYDRFMLSYDDRISKYSVLKETKSIDNLSYNTTELNSSIISKSQTSGNDRNGLSSKNQFAIPYLYEENENDIDSLSSISSGITNNIFPPLPTVDSFSYSSINLKSSLIKRILEILSLSNTINKATKDEKLSKKLLRRILSCLPFINKSFLSEGIDLLEFSLILVSKAEKPMHWKYSLLVLANVAHQMESPCKKEEETSEDVKVKERSKSEKNKQADEETVTARERRFSFTNNNKLFEKNFTINDSFISSFSSIYNDNIALIPRDEFIICLREIIEKTICQDDSKLHELLKIVNSNQKEYISPSGLNVFISNINFSIKLENLDISSLWLKLFSFKGIPSFYIRGCSLIFNVMHKTIQMTNFPQFKNAAQAIFEARKEFFNGMTDGINSLLNIFYEFDLTLSTRSIELAHKMQKIYASQEVFSQSIKQESDQSSESNTEKTQSTIYSSSQAQNISLSQSNLKKVNQQSNKTNEDNIKYNSQSCTCNFFIDKEFYNLILLILSRSLIQSNISYLIKQYEYFLIDPRRAEFDLSSLILPFLIKKLTASQQAVKKIQTYVSSFILPKHIATVNYHHKIDEDKLKSKSANNQDESEVTESTDSSIISNMNSFDIGGFDIYSTSILPVYLNCIIEIIKVVPDNVNNTNSRITNSLLELFHACKDFDCFCFSQFIWKWNVLIAEHSTAENALNLSCTTFPNVLPRFFPLFAAIVKFVKGYNYHILDEEKDKDLSEEEKLKIEMFQNYLTSASLISHEKTKAHGLAFQLLADNKRTKDALDLAQFDHDCDESDSLISVIRSQIGKD